MEKITILDLILSLIAIGGWTFFVTGLAVYLQQKRLYKKYGKCPYCNGMGTRQLWMRRIDDET